MLDKLRIEERKSGKLILIQIHHEEFVSGSQLNSFTRELPVEVGNIFSVALEEKKLGHDWPSHQDCLLRIFLIFYQPQLITDIELVIRVTLAWPGFSIFRIRLTILGLKGGWTSLASSFSQSILLKKEWDLISSSPFSRLPNLLLGFLTNN